MSAPTAAPNARFLLESHTRSGQFVCSLPYNNLQGESFMNDQGCALRGNIPYRDYPQVTLANLAADKHEIWLYDRNVSLIDPIFAGPMWSCTASSSTGNVAFAAQGRESYLAKRTMYADQSYGAITPASLFVDLIAYTQSAANLGLTTSKVTDNASTAAYNFLATDRNVISDLLKAHETDLDGTDWYIRSVNRVPTFFIYGGQKKPTHKTIALQYGGTMTGHSVQYNAQKLANYYDMLGSTGAIGNANSGIAPYNLFQVVDRSSDLTDITSLNAAAATALKGTLAMEHISTLTTKSYTPILDFDFGDLVHCIINDHYVQEDSFMRIVGWQLTIGQNDEITTGIYTNTNMVVS